MIRAHRSLSFALALLPALAAGCTPLNVTQPFRWPLFDEKPVAPARLTAVWTDSVYYTAGRPPTRGFGGRLMFYGPGKNRPVRVEGDLVIYAFLEDGRDPSNVRPDRKYVITAEQLERQYSRSEVGHSYSVWVPWGPAEGPQHEISLIARFTPVNGHVVVSEQTRLLLPGPRETAASPEPNAQKAPRVAATEIATADYAPTGAVHRASHEEPAPPAEAQLATTTIDVPPRFGRTNWSSPIPTRPRHHGFTRPTAATAPGAPSAAGASDPQNHHQTPTHHPQAQAPWDPAWAPAAAPGLAPQAPAHRDAAGASVPWGPGAYPAQTATDLPAANPSSHPAEPRPAAPGTAAGWGAPTFVPPSGPPPPQAGYSLPRPQVPEGPTARQAAAAPRFGRTPAMSPSRPAPSPPRAWASASEPSATAGW